MVHVQPGLSQTMKHVAMGHIQIYQQVSEVTHAFIHVDHWLIKILIDPIQVHKSQSTFKDIIKKYTKVRMYSHR